MSQTDIIRAWKDEEFRESLGSAAVPAHPAGQIELADTSLSVGRDGLMPVTITKTWWLLCTYDCTSDC